MAERHLGDMYEMGWGVPQDYVEAVKWFRRAAEQGNAWAQTDLGLGYAEGQGVPQDYVLAHMWFNLAAASEQDASASLGRHKRDEIGRLMTPDQIAEAQRMAREWKPKPER